jgi:hypothetical protein
MPLPGFNPKSLVEPVIRREAHKAIFMVQEKIAIYEDFR